MLPKKIHQKIHLYAALLIAVSLPFSALTAIFVVLMLLNWLIEGDFKNKFTALYKQPLALLFIGLYLLHVVGLSYTDQFKSGTFDLEVKLSLLLFPLMLASKPFERKQLNLISLVFVLSCVLASLILLGKSSWIYLQTGENHFFYQAFSVWIHPSYFSLYIGLALVLAYKLYRDQVYLKNRILVFGLLIFLSGITVLLSSKMGLAVYVLLVLIFLIYQIVSRKKYALGIGGLLLAVVLVFIIIQKVPAVGARVKQLFTVVNANQIDRSNSESSAVRLLIWEASREVLKEHYLLGVGTGDVKAALMQKYQKLGMTGAYENKLNAHNSYYQLFIALGIPGITLFLLSLFLPFIQAFKRKKWVLVLFITMIIIHFMVESMLETQAGVLFYGFFASLLCFGEEIGTGRNYEL